MGNKKGKHSLLYFCVRRSGGFTELNYGQDRLCGLDFQVEQGQHSVQAEKKNVRFLKC